MLVRNTRNCVDPELAVPLYLCTSDRHLLAGLIACGVPFVYGAHCT